MEKVWEELKKIETQAQEIRVEAQEKSKQITTTVQDEAEKLVANAKSYAEQDAQQHYDWVVREAKRLQQEALIAIEKANKRLQQQAQRHLDEAAELIVQAVLGESKVGASDKVR
ncbi:MAG: hypothetical protein NWE98_10740 [Candidatus Bathyarchaeota archaeon]|nr:hypothetical protein [Candidatus Bathyarchaeota archaeon]